jgi:plasmid stabilization system protein ParE
MTKPLRFDDEAAEELDMAAAWYEARRRNLGVDFMTAVREALQRIAATPRTWPLVRDVPERLNVRRFLLRRFPYSIVFIEPDEEIRVLAIAHTSREPGFWRHRL